MLPASDMILGMKILAPAFAKAKAKACPKPLLPPVTRAVLPLREKKSMEKFSIDMLWVSYIKKNLRMNWGSDQPAKFADHESRELTADLLLRSQVQKQNTIDPCSYMKSDD